MSDDTNNPKRRKLYDQRPDPKRDRETLEQYRDWEQSPVEKEIAYLKRGLDQDRLTLQAAERARPKGQAAQTLRARVNWAEQQIERLGG
jgi:hypothetical protein